jgi:dihydrodipicolinate synthase/N-acetylneuraminate lyase
MKKEIKGIIPPVITSFDKTGNFDEKAQREVIRFLLPHIHGFYPTGTYGSGPLMNCTERKKVAEVIIDEVNGKVPVIIHVGASNTVDAVDLARHAESIGADAIGSIPPWYYKYPEADLLDYFRALINAVQIPVFVYNNPELSNNPMTPGMVKILAAEGLAGYKDSKFDILNFYSFLEAVKDPKFIPIVGTEAIAAAAVEAGARGVISGLANVWPELMFEFWQILQTNDGRRSAEMQLKVNRARNVMKLGPTLVCCYEVLNMRGVNAGYPRRPFGPLPEDIRLKVRAGFTEMGLLK